MSRKHIAILTLSGGAVLLIVGLCAGRFSAHYGAPARPASAPAPADVPTDGFSDSVLEAALVKEQLVTTLLPDSILASDSSGILVVKNANVPDEPLPRFVVPASSPSHEPFALPVPPISEVPSSGIGPENMPAGETRPPTPALLPFPEGPKAKAAPQDPGEVPARPVAPGPRAEKTDPSIAKDTTGDNSRLVALPPSPAPPGPVAPVPEEALNSRKSAFPERMPRQASAPTEYHFRHRERLPLPESFRSLPPKRREALLGPGHLRPEPLALKRAPLPHPEPTPAGPDIVAVPSDVAPPRLAWRPGPLRSVNLAREAPAPGNEPVPNVLNPRGVGGSALGPTHKVSTATPAGAGVSPSFPRAVRGIPKVTLAPRLTGTPFPGANVAWPPGGGPLPELVRRPVSEMPRHPAEVNVPSAVELPPVSVRLSVK